LKPLLTVPLWGGLIALSSMHHLGMLLFHDGIQLCNSLFSVLTAVTCFIEGNIIRTSMLHVLSDKHME